MHDDIAFSLSLLGHDCEVVRASFGRSAFSRHFHDTFSIGLVTTGVNTFSYRRKRVEVPAGAVCVADPGEVHDGGLHGAPWSYCSIFVPAEVLNELRREVGDRDETVWTREVAFEAGWTEDIDVRTGLARLFRAVLRDGADNQSEMGALSEERAIDAFSTLLDRCAVAKAREQRANALKASRSQAIAERALDMMRDCMGNGIDLSDLAHATGASRFAVIRAVRQAINLTPTTYMMQLRTERARLLVRYGMPLAEVAAEVGFADQAHMTRCMKRFFGVTPGRIARR